jgi:hypothetical protein
MRTTPRTILYSFIKDPENRLREYRDRFRGERGFIIANGPSLNETDLSSLGNEITFGVNRIYRHFGRMGFQPTFYYVEDSSIIRHHADEIRASITRSTKIFPYVYHTVFDDGVYVNYNPYASILHARFSTDASRKVYWGGLCTYAVMQIVYYMGFETVYLVGPGGPRISSRAISVRPGNTTCRSTCGSSTGRIDWRDVCLRRTIERLSTAQGGGNSRSSRGSHSKRSYVADSSGSWSGAISATGSSRSIRGSPLNGGTTQVSRAGVPLPGEACLDLAHYWHTCAQSDGIVLDPPAS